MPQDLPQGFYIAATVFLGLVFGSFATALAYRVPRGISILKKARSSCPACGRDLALPDLVPVFSWLFLGGKCRSCRARIGFEYPAIELCTLLLCLFFHARFGFTAESLCLFALAPVLVALAAIDFRYMILPDGLNLAVFGLGAAALLASALQSPDAPAYIISHGGSSLLAAAGYALFFIVLRSSLMAVLKKDPLGWGDVKFIAAAGFWLGLNPDSAAYLMLAAGVTGIILALGWRRVKGEAEFPFGPALLTGFVAMLLWQGPDFFLR